VNRNGRLTPIETAVLKVVVEVRELVAGLSGTFGLEVPPGFDSNHDEL